MIPNSPLGRKQLKNLKVYTGADFAESDKGIEALNLSKK